MVDVRASALRACNAAETLQEVRRKRSTSVRLIHNRVSRLFSLAISGLQLARLIPRARIRSVYAPIPD
jgi:hypothetical protein